MVTKDKETAELSDDRGIEKEVAALIQVVNGLNEVYDDDAKFERVYKYIEMRYNEKREARREDTQRAVIYCLCEQLERMESTLKEIRDIAISEVPDISRIPVVIDECTREVKDIPNRKVSDLNVYKEAKRRSA
jgi:hypothetical protein